MYNFKKFLIEYVNFAKAKDNDFPLDDGIIFLSKNARAEYKLKGNTHGEYSHAVKHYIEFNSGTVMSFAAEIKGILDKFHTEGLLDYIELYNFSNKKSIKGYDQVMAKAKTLDFINTLDYLNDKNIEKTGFNKIELEVKRIGDKLRKLYDEEIQKRINSAVDLDTLKMSAIKQLIANNSIIKFSANKNEIYILDLNSNVLIVQRNNEIATCFVFNRTGTGNAVIKNLLRKKPYLKYKSKAVENVFNSLV